MAFPAANFWFGDRTVHFGTKSTDPHPAPEIQNLAVNLGFYYHVWTGIGQQNMRDRTGFAQIVGPVMRRICVPDQAAFFLFAPAKIIAIKVLTFNPGWCFHLKMFTI